MKTEWELEKDFFGEKINRCFKEMYDYSFGGLSKSITHVKLIEDTIIDFEKEIHRAIPSASIIINRDKYSFYRLDCILDNKNNRHYMIFDITENQIKWKFSLTSPLMRSWYRIDFTSDYKKIVKLFSEIYNLYPTWKNEFEPILIEHHKQIKKKELAETSIEVMLKNAFAGTGYKYNLLKNDRKLKKKKMLEVRLDHKKFAQQIKSVPEYLEKISKLIDDSPFAINIKTYGNGINWQESK